MSRLKRVPNIHLLGQRPHAELPRLRAGLRRRPRAVPHHRYTANVYPTKLNEYLVDGHPGRRDRSARDPPLQRASTATWSRRRPSRCVRERGQRRDRCRSHRAEIAEAHRGRAIEQLGTPARGDVGADRRASTRGPRETDGLGRPPRAVLPAPRRRRAVQIVGALARRVCSLLFQTQRWSGGWPSRCGSPQPPRPPTRSSSSPAASASRAGPAAAYQERVGKRSICIVPACAPRIDLLVGLRVHASAKPK